MTNIIATTKAASPDGTMSAELYRELQRMGRATSAAAAAAAANTQSLADFIAGADWGSVIYKGETDWAWLEPGTSGQVLKTNGADADPEWVDQNGITLGTYQAATSGTSIDFTSIPSGVKHITMSVSGLSTNGTSNYFVQIGTGGTATTSGYSGRTARLGGGGATYFTSGLGLLITGSVSSTVLHVGTLDFFLIDAATNLWGARTLITESGGDNEMHIGSWSVALSGALDFIRFTTSGGTNTFDAGGINIQYF